MSDKQTIMEQIDKSVSHCTKCRLYKTAKCGVPGEGNINTEIVFVGEAPGATEDATGRPFVGRAGMLLESMLKEIGNIIKHRPPENRDPLPDEIAACEPYLAAQLKIINPVLVVTLGRFSMNYFYTEGKITRDHGNMLRVNGYTIYPVYHPAAALRSSAMMATLKADFMRIPKVLYDARALKVSENRDKMNDQKDQTGLGL